MTIHARNRHSMMYFQTANNINLAWGMSRYHIRPILTAFPPKLILMLSSYIPPVFQAPTRTNTFPPRTLASPVSSRNKRLERYLRNTGRRGRAFDMRGGIRLNNYYLSKNIFQLHYSDRAISQCSSGRCI